MPLPDPKAAYTPVPILPIVRPGTPHPHSGTLAPVPASDTPNNPRIPIWEKYTINNQTTKQNPPLSNPPTPASGPIHRILPIPKSPPEPKPTSPIKTLPISTLHSSSLIPLSTNPVAVPIPEFLRLHANLLDKVVSFEAIPSALIPAATPSPEKMTSPAMTSPAKSPPPHSTNPIRPIRLIGPRLPGSPRRPILPPIPQFGIPSLGLPPCCPGGMKTSFRPKIGQIEKFMSLSMTPGYFLAAEVGGEGFRVVYSVLPAWKREGAGLDLKGRDRDEGDGDGDEDEDGEMEGSEKDEDEGSHQEEGLEIEEEEGGGVDRVVEWVDSLVDHYDGFVEMGDREDQEDQVGLFDQGSMERTRNGGGIMQLHPDLVAGLEALELEWDEDFVDDKEGGLDAASDSGLGTLDEEGSQADEAGDEDNFDDDQDDEIEEELEALLEVLLEDLTLDKEPAEEKHEPLVEDEKMKQGYLRYAVAPLKRKFGH